MGNKTFAILLFISLFSCKKNDNSVITVTDIDGNNYNTIRIGEQLWMKENLVTTKFNDGVLIPYKIEKADWAINAEPAYCWYNNIDTNKISYGALYNWHVIKTNKLCPTGWHLPSDSEWTQLVNYLISNGYNADGSYSGDNTAKSLATSFGWHPFLTSNPFEQGVPGYESQRNNSSGFSVIPGGFRDQNGYYSGMNFSAFFWSSTEYDSNTAFARRLSYRWNDLYQFNIDKRYGMYVRCIKD